MENNFLASRASEDFDRSYRGRFWRKLNAWLTGKSNELLPYDVVREQIPFDGQHDLGMHTIPVNKIIGSVGRYRDFDRAFFPTQETTSARWINIRKAHYHAIELPPIDVYKIGEVYFVRDGNHRVSVARERKQAYIEAHVIEINIPIPITTETKVDDLVRQHAYAEFMQKTGLSKLGEPVDLELSVVGDYGRLFHHIDAHQYYLGLDGQKVSYKETAVSWYRTVYQPMLDTIAEHDLQKKFPDKTLTDMYLFVSEYQWLRREFLTDAKEESEEMPDLAALYSDEETRLAIKTLRQQQWIDSLILRQEQAHFEEYTNIKTLRPEADIRLSLAGKYDKILHHISTHRWYMGEQLGHDIPYADAVTSWYDNAYLPTVQMIKDDDVLSHFTNRTEADLYLWMVDHRDHFITQSTPA